ncbi:hypothetical protein GGI35DRAFT_14654 [Trichoderma velutinum]
MVRWGAGGEQTGHVARARKGYGVLVCSRMFVPPAPAFKPQPSPSVGAPAGAKGTTRRGGAMAGCALGSDTGLSEMADASSAHGRFSLLTEVPPQRRYMLLTCSMQCSLRCAATPPHQKSVLPLLGPPRRQTARVETTVKEVLSIFWRVLFCAFLLRIFLSNLFLQIPAPLASFLLVHLRFKLRFAQSIAITNLNCHVQLNVPRLLLCTVPGGMRRSLCRARLIGRHSPEKLFAWLSEVWRTNKCYLETKPRRESRLGRF